MENEELDISLLTPGSVWLRTRKGETLSNQVLVLSNLHLSEKMQAKYPPEVVYLDEDGNAQATWADTLNLDDWLDEYTLDEVWRMGRMGARS